MCMCVIIDLPAEVRAVAHAVVCKVVSERESSCVCNCERGVIMILLNVGSKFIAISFSKSTEEYLKYSLSKQILVFSMAWLGTRDIYTALGLTAVFSVLSEHLFNEESPYCVVPEKYHVLKNVMDTNNDGVISDQEITAAIVVLEKARKANNVKKQDNKHTDNQKNNVTMNLV